MSGVRLSNVLKTCSIKVVKKYESVFALFVNAFLSVCSISSKVLNIEAIFAIATASEAVYIVTEE